MTTAAFLPNGLDEPTVDLPGVEIFRAGDYGTVGKFGEDFIAALASNYDAKAHEAPITIDHADAGPAYGWIGRAFAEGEILKADLVGVPSSLARAVESGRYKKRSIEFYETADGKPMIRAVSVLGSQVPRVKGLRDVKFSEPADGAKLTRVESDSSPSPEAGRILEALANSAPRLSFAEIVDPDPSSHGVIVNQSSTGDIMEHFHHAYLDADGNGFTSGPVTSEWDEGNYKTEEDATGHRHAVKAGVVQAAGDIPHTHTLYLFTSKTTDGATQMSERAAASSQSNPNPKTADTQEASAMPDANTTTTPAAVDPVKFSEAQGELAATKAELAAIRAERFAEKEAARFDAAFGEALAAGKVSPAEKPALSFLFSELPADTVANVKKFGEGDKAATPRAAFIASLNARPVAIAVNASAPTGKTFAEANADRATGGDKNAKIIELTNKKFSESGGSKSIEQCAIEAATEVGA